MDTSLANRRVFIGSIIVAEEKTPESYQDIADANDHLRNVIDALLKERLGQTLDKDERRLIDRHIEARRWQFENSKQVDDV